MDEIDTTFWRTHIERISVNTHNFITIPTSSVLSFCDEIDRLRATIEGMKKSYATARAEALEEAAKEVELRCAPDGLGQILAGYILALKDTP